MKRSGRSSTRSTSAHPTSSRPIATSSWHSPRSSSPRRRSTRKPSRRCSVTCRPRKTCTGRRPSSVPGSPSASRAPSRRKPAPDDRRPWQRDASGPATARSFDSGGRRPGRRPYNPTMLATDAALKDHVEASRDARLEDYMKFLRIPSISGQPQHAPDCRRAAEWIAIAMAEAGLEHAEVCETGGHPVVYGDWLHAPGAPTLLVYAHYDVQPVDPLDLWTSPPFEPVIVDGKMLARGSSDDKAHIIAHLAAAQGLLATRGALPVNVKYIFEGEEESSSVHLETWL